MASPGYTSTPYVGLGTRVEARVLAMSMYGITRLHIYPLRGIRYTSRSPCVSYVDVWHHQVTHLPTTWIIRLPLPSRVRAWSDTWFQLPCHSPSARKLRRCPVVTRQTPHLWDIGWWSGYFSFRLSYCVKLCGSFNLCDQVDELHYVLFVHLCWKKDLNILTETTELDPLL